MWRNGPGKESVEEDDALHVATRRGHAKTDSDERRNRKELRIVQEAFVDFSADAKASKPQGLKVSRARQPGPQIRHLPSKYLPKQEFFRHNLT